MTTAIYNVDGMTCGHCVNAVSSELAKLAGVTDVSVNLEAGAVTVASDAALDRDDVRAAISAAGYTLTA